MDWNGLHADENCWLNKHYTPGREGREIDKILIHHNAGILSITDCYNVWQDRQASAHYQVEVDGTIGQLVHDADAAWHAGDWETNLRSIGIEHSNSGGAAQGWPISDATVEAGAHLVAAICHYYGLGRPAWGVNVFPHQHFQSTACPGQLAGQLRDRYMSRASQWYDAMATGADVAPAVSAPSENGPLVVDAIIGPASIRRLQEVLGTVQDSIISGQYAPNIEHVPAAGDGWEWTNAGEGSAAIAELQRRLGVTADGILGPDTIRAWQRRLGVTADGYLGSATATMIQRALNAGRLW